MAFAEFETQGVEEVQRMFDRLETEMPKRAAQVVNSATRDSRAEGSKATRELTTLKAQAVNRRLQFTKRATRNRPAGQITASDKGIQLRFFQVKGGTQPRAGARRGRGQGGRRPVVVQFERNSPVEIEGAFQQRDTRARFFIRDRGAGRYPIRAVIGPSVATLMDNNQQIFARMRKRAEDSMTRNTLKALDQLTR